MIKTVKNERGMALITAALFITLIGMAGLALISNTGQDSDISIKQMHSTQAFFLAEAGIHRAISELENNMNWLPNGTAYKCGNGEYGISLDKSDPSNYVITSEGITHTNSGDTRRTVVSRIGVISGFGGTPFKYVLFSKNKPLELKNDVVGDIYVDEDFDVNGSSIVQINGSVQATGDYGINKHYISPFNTIERASINNPGGIFHINGHVYTNDTINVKEFKSGKSMKFYGNCTAEVFEVNGIFRQANSDSGHSSGDTSNLTLTGGNPMKVAGDFRTVGKFNMTGGDLHTDGDISIGWSANNFSGDLWATGEIKDPNNNIPDSNEHPYESGLNVVVEDNPVPILDFPEVDVDTVIEEAEKGGTTVGSITIDKKTGPITLGPQLIQGDLIVTGKADVTLEGVIYVQGDVKFSGIKSIKTTEGYSIIADGDIHFDGDSMAPKDIFPFLLSTEGDVKINTVSYTEAAIVATGGKVEVGGAGTIKGCIYGGKISLPGISKVEYDTSFAGNIPNGVDGGKKGKTTVLDTNNKSWTESSGK